MCMFLDDAGVVLERHPSKAERVIDAFHALESDDENFAVAASEVIAYAKHKL